MSKCDVKLEEIQGVEWSIVWKEMVSEVEGEAFMACVRTLMVYSSCMKVIRMTEESVLRRTELWCSR